MFRQLIIRPNPKPLMFSFHGGGGNGQGMIGLNDMRPIADTANFIAVYPSGADGAWMHKVPRHIMIFILSSNHLCFEY